MVRVRKRRSVPDPSADKRKRNNPDPDPDTDPDLAANITTENRSPPPGDEAAAASGDGDGDNPTRQDAIEERPPEAAVMEDDHEQDHHEEAAVMEDDHEQDHHEEAAMEDDQEAEEDHHEEAAMEDDHEAEQDHHEEALISKPEEKESDPDDNSDSDYVAPPPRPPQAELDNWRSQWIKDAFDDTDPLGEAKQVLLARSFTKAQKLSQLFRRIRNSVNANLNRAMVEVAKTIADAEKTAEAHRRAEELLRDAEADRDSLREQLALAQRRAEDAEAAREQLQNDIEELRAEREAQEEKKLRAIRALQVQVPLEDVKAGARNGNNSSNILQTDHQCVISATSAAPESTESRLQRLERRLAVLMAYQLVSDGEHVPK